MTPRSKHYGVKYHWFRTKLKPNEIEIDRVDTSLQKADFLTKALRTKAFEKNRKLPVVGKDYVSLERECEETAYVVSPVCMYDSHDEKQAIVS
jgi:hypothetical protein